MRIYNSYLRHEILDVLREGRVDVQNLDYIPQNEEENFLPTEFLKKAI